MKKIILPIKSKYVRQILNGTKKYEFRKRKCSQEIDTIYIYETAPTKKIVGTVKVIEILEGTPEEIWSKCCRYSGIEKKSYDDYFKNTNKAYAFSLGQYDKFVNPKELKDYGVNFTPQSFVYI